MSDEKAFETPTNDESSQPSPSEDEITFNEMDAENNAEPGSEHQGDAIEGHVDLDESELPQTPDPAENETPEVTVQEAANETPDSPEAHKPIPNLDQPPSVDESREDAQELVESTTKEQIKNLFDQGVSPETEQVKKDATKDGKKEEERKFLSLKPIELTKRERVKSLFVLPPDYETAHKQGLDEERVFIIYGPEYTGKSTCAVHLGMVLRGEILLLTEDQEQTDIYQPYEDGLNLLQDRLGENHLYASEAVNYRHQLLENITRARRYGETTERTAERNAIIDQINRFTSRHLGVTFTELYEFARSGEPVEAPNSMLRLEIYNRTENEADTLLDFIQRPSVNEDAIYIIEDAFDKGITPDHLSSSLFSTLDKKNIYLIFTQENQSESLDSLPTQVRSIFAYSRDEKEYAKFMQRVFDKYLDDYQFRIPPKPFELAGKEKLRLSTDLQWPFAVENFFEELRNLPLDANEDDLWEVAGRVGRLGQTLTRSWFEKLPYNAKLYAMLVVLFEGVDRLTLDEIYIEAVDQLRKDGVSKLRDPRELGLDDMLRYINAEDTIGRLVAFKVSAYEQEVHRQIHNHHPLLWSLIGVLLNLIESYKAPEYWEFRKALGAAIGQLGIYRVHKLYPVLDKLAHDESGGVVAVAGYGLDKICRLGYEHFDFVTALLEYWVESGDPDLMWAAGASVWRIYDGLVRAPQLGPQRTLQAQRAENALKRVNEIFTKLAENFDHFNRQAYDQAWEEVHKLTKATGQPLSRQGMAGLVAEQAVIWATNNMRSILHAVRQISSTYSKHIVKQIIVWLEAEDSNLRNLGLLAGRQLFQENARPEMSFTEERHLSLLNLIGPLLSAEAELSDKTETVDTIVRALLVWLQHTEWANHIHQSLLHVVNRSMPTETGILCNSITTHWLASDSPKAQDIGQKLFTRSYAIHGFPMTMPGHHHGIIVLDASGKARLSQSSARVGHILYRHLDSRVDIRLGRMGQTKPLRKPGQNIIVADLQTEHDRPSLLVPVLEVLEPSNAYFILVITWQKIIDLEDFWAEAQPNHLIVASAKEETQWPEKLKVVPFDHRTPEYDLRAIDAAVSIHLARILSDLGPDDWWTAIQPCLKLQSTDVDTIVAKLESWIKNLDNIEYAGYPYDTARIINCVILWLSTADLPRCIEVVRKWLTAERDLFQMMGAACSALLFNVYAQCDPVPPVESHARLLELAPVLARQTWNGVKAVLVAVRHWAVSDDWAQRLLAHPEGEPSELMQLVDTVPSENHDDLAQILEHWSAPIETEDEETVSQAVIRLGERLRLRLALGTHQLLPDLPEGHSYGLIIVDTAVQDEQTRQHLAELISDLVQTLPKDLEDRSHQMFDFLVYRLGQDHFLAGPGETLKPEKLIPPEKINQPHLLGPVLERHTVDQVSFVLLFSDDQPLIDGEDWHDTAWAERIFIYTTVDRPAWARSFAVIPWMLDLKEAKKAVLRHLLEKTGV